MTHAELAAAGVDIDQPAYDRLARFVALLLEENRKLNLTAIRQPERAWLLHVCDSLALLPLLRDRPPANLLDLGSGGGIPGIPLACVLPDLPITLLDATQKKLHAVQRIADTLGLTHVTTLWGRAEKLAHDRHYRERFDRVVARAVAPLPALVEYACGFVRVGGQCWFMKTPAALADEVPAAANAASICGLKPGQHLEYGLSNAGGPRVVLVYDKIHPLRASMPRAQGGIQRNPL